MNSIFEQWFEHKISEKVGMIGFDIPLSILTYLNNLGFCFYTLDRNSASEQVEISRSGEVILKWGKFTGTHDEQLDYLLECVVLEETLCKLESIKDN